MLLKRLVTLFMVSMILFADSGQMIYAHICLESGETSFSLNAAKHCCDEKQNEKGSCKIEKDCCYDTAKYIKQVFVNSGNDIEKKSLEPPVVYESGISPLLLSLLSPIQNTYHPPILPSGKKHLSLIQVFRC